MGSLASNFISDANSNPVFNGIRTSRDTKTIGIAFLNDSRPSKCIVEKITIKKPLAFKVFFHQWTQGTINRQPLKFCHEQRLLKYKIIKDPCFNTFLHFLPLLTYFRISHCQLCLAINYKHQLSCDYKHFLSWV